MYNTRRCTTALFRRGCHQTRITDFMSLKQVETSCGIAVKPSLFDVKQALEPAIGRPKTYQSRFASPKLAK